MIGINNWTGRDAGAMMLVNTEAQRRGASDWRAELEGRQRKPMKLDQEQINYPRDLFSALIDGNSPYAFYLFQWVPYQTEAKRWRLKMCHDVRTFDGREAFGIWPNGSHCGPFKDEEVEFIRISKEQHGGRGWVDPRPGPSNPQIDGENPSHRQVKCQNLSQ